MLFVHRHRFCSRRLNFVVACAVCVLNLQCWSLRGSPAGVEASAVSPAGSSPRERLLLDFNWRFQLGDPPDAGTVFDNPEPSSLDKTVRKDFAEWEKLDAARQDAAAVNLGSNVSYVQAEMDEHSWQHVDLPHDWAVELPFNPRGNISHGKKDIDPKKGTNIGWYRRTFEMPAADRGRQISVFFDGVYRNSLVWLNEQCLGRFPSGYTSFHYDLTKHIKFGALNTLVARVDATRNEGWFYEGAGIYRHAWLVKTDPLHVAAWGTQCVSRLEGSDASISISTDVENDGDRPVSGTLVSRIVDALGNTVASASEPFGLEPTAHNVFAQTVKVAAPKLWSIEAPYLYNVVTTIKRAEVIADIYETPLGIRTIRFDPELGFFLNGKNVKIKGTCNHQDHAGVGSALPDRLQFFRIEQLKAMGSNAYRTAHNPPTPELLDACDRLGMLVLDENRRFDARPQTLADLETLIRRDRNHPSVILWSIGNEEMEMGRGENDKVATAIASTMQDLVHKLDSTRPVTIGHNGAWKTFGKGFCNVMEMLGCNYYNHENKDLDSFLKNHPKQLLIGTEEASTLCTRGQYSDDPHAGFVQAYDRDFPKWGSTAEAWWKFYANRPWLPGAFVWTGFDYRGEPTPYNFAYSSQFGVMDTCGFPKDIYYFYKAWWTEVPVLHLLPHWNWVGKEGQEIEVWAFSNCNEVELFLNGQSIGRKTMEQNSHLEWKVKFAPGTLSAKGYRNGQIIAEAKVETTGSPAGIKLTPDRSSILADGQDISVVTAAVIDAQGRTVPTASNLLEFELIGGKIIGVGNGNPNTAESDKEPRRKVFNGLAQVIIQAPRKPIAMHLTARSEGLNAAAIVIDSHAGTPRPAVP